MAAREYLNFDLELGPRAEGYVAHVRASPVGETSGTFTLPFTPEGLENVALRLGHSRTTVRRIATQQDDLAKAFGSSLYDAVFAGEIGTSLRRSIDEAARQGKGLRIRLHLEDAPELGDVPWELLYVPGLSRHLVLSSSTPLVRYLGLPGTPRPLRVDGPIRVLLVVAAPTDVVRLDAAHEVTLIEEATSDLRQAGAIEIDSLPAARLRELQRRLRRADYHVLHFVGHGGFDDGLGEGMLAFEGDDGRSHMVPTSHLGTILADHNTLRLTVLNACEGARSGATDPFAGVAPGLIRQGIPAVIAMQFEVTDTAAATFGHEFYLALADGCPVDQAAAEARKAMYASDCDVEWATPVLYLRASDSRIFVTPSIDHSQLERPAFLGAPVSTDELLETEREHRNASTASARLPSQTLVPMSQPAPAPRAGSTAEHHAAGNGHDGRELSPWALERPIEVHEPSPVEPPVDGSRGSARPPLFAGRGSGAGSSKSWVAEGSAVRSKEPSSHPSSRGADPQDVSSRDAGTAPTSSGRAVQPRRPVNGSRNTPSEAPSRLPSPARTAARARRRLLLLVLVIGVGVAMIGLAVARGSLFDGINDVPTDARNGEHVVSANEDPGEDEDDSSNNGPSQSTDVEIPPLKNLTEIEAAEELERLRLRSTTIEESSDRVDEGLVIASRPPEGRVVEAGDTVTVVVSTGPAPVELPNVVGRPVDEARAILEAMGLGVSDDYEPSDDVAEGSVIRQDPGEGTPVDRGESVTLVVSNGAESMTTEQPSED